MAIKYVFLPHKHKGVCVSGKTKLLSDYTKSCYTDSDKCSHSNHHGIVTQYYHYWWWKRHFLMLEWQ